MDNVIDITNMLARTEKQKSETMALIKIRALEIYIWYIYIICHIIYFKGPEKQNLNAFFVISLTNILNNRACTAYVTVVNEEAR